MIFGHFFYCFFFGHVQLLKPEPNLVPGVLFSRNMVDQFLVTFAFLYTALCPSTFVLGTILPVVGSEQEYGQFER